VADIRRSIAFYRDGLGFPVAMTFQKDGELKGAYFSVGDRSFLEVFELDTPIGITHFCLETNDLDAFIKAATAGNITCTPKEIGGCHTWQRWLRDPDGNAFEMHQYTDRSMQFRGGECEFNWRF